MAATRVDNINIDNARIGFRNFSGKEGKFNTEGNRNFAVFLENDLADVLEQDGWNVRWLQPKHEDADKQAFLQVKVGFGAYPPKIILIANGKKSQLDESTISILDWAEIQTVDLTLRPYTWDVNGRHGIKAYLKTMYVTLMVDDFESKYEMIPDSATDGIGGCGNCEICQGDCNNPEHL